MHGILLQADRKLRQILEQQLGPQVQNGGQLMLQLQQHVNILPTGCSRWSPDRAGCPCRMHFVSFAMLQTG